MRAYLSILVCLLSLSLFAATGLVTTVADGDTVWVKQNGRRVKLRLDRIDAPEMNQPWGDKSADRLAELVLGKTVTYDDSHKDKYGRVLAVLMLGDKDINLQMVREGQAWHYSYFDHTPAYAAAEKEARAAKRGLWSQPDPVNPYRWRKANPSDGGEEYHKRTIKNTLNVNETPCGPMFSFPREDMIMRARTGKCAFPQDVEWISTNQLKVIGVNLQYAERFELVAREEGKPDVRSALEMQLIKPAVTNRSYSALIRFTPQQLEMIEKSWRTTPKDKIFFVYARPCGGLLEVCPPWRDAKCRRAGR